MSLARAFASVGAATMASRVLGFLRDGMIAAALGTGPVADAFVVAFRLPNLFRRLFAEGAFNSAFVPLYARALEEGGPAGARRFAGEVFAALAFVLALFTALAMAAAPLLVWALAPGFATDASKFDLTAAMTRITLPYLACMSLIAMLGGILNAHRRFFVAAMAPVLLNLVLIAVLAAILLLDVARTETAGRWLAWGVAAAGLVQLTALALAVRRAGLGFRLARPRATGSVRELARLGLPGLLAGGVTQINIVAGTIIASMSAGSVSYLYYADRVYQLPLGVVGIAIGVVLLPEVARQVRAGREDLALAAQNRSLEFGAVLTLPAALALIVAARPIVEVLFERGAFGPQDTMQTAAALAAFGAGLPAFVAVKVLAPAYFARLDTRTPMWIGVVAVAVNIGLALALRPFLDHVAIAVATSVAGWLNAGLLYAGLLRRNDWRTDAELAHRLPRIVAAAVVMAVVLWPAVDLLDPWTGAENPLHVKVAALTLLCGGGVAVHFLVAQALGGVELRGLVGKLRRRSEAA